RTTHIVTLSLHDALPISRANDERTIPVAASVSGHMSWTSKTSGARRARAIARPANPEVSGGWYAQTTSTEPVAGPPSTAAETAKDRKSTRLNSSHLGSSY